MMVSNLPIYFRIANTSQVWIAKRCKYTHSWLTEKVVNQWYITYDMTFCKKIMFIMIASNFIDKFCLVVTAVELQPEHT